MPSDAPLKNIVWLAAPLALDQRAIANQVLTPYVGSVVPMEEYHSQRLFHHWALEVDDECYELSPHHKKPLKIVKLLTDMCEYHHRKATDWHQHRTILKVVPEMRKVGQTSMTP